MTGQTIKVTILRQYKEAGRALPIEEQKARIQQADAIRNECGGRLLVSADAHWSSGDIFGFSAEVFPGIEAAQKHAAALDKIDWFRYVDSESFLGFPEILNQPVYEKGILQLQVIRGMKEQAYALRNVMGMNANDAVQNDISANIDKLRGRRILRISCRWSREDVWAVQLLEWPDLDALRKQVAFEDLRNWSLMFDQKHYLGTRA